MVSICELLVTKYPIIQEQYCMIADAYLAQP